ncbi:MAG TPA: cyclase family protein [Bordetella sp.]
MKRWTHRPEGSTWGDWGEDDQLGRLNLLTPARVLRASREILTGERFCLSLPLDYPGGSVLAPHRKPPQLAPTMRSGRPFANYAFGQEGPFCDCGNDDIVTLCTQYSTQWDSLAHIGCRFDAHGTGQERMTYYNGYAETDIVAPGEPGKATMPLGIQTMAAAAIQGRGVMVDLHAHLGAQRRRVGYDTLMEIFEADGLAVEEGDILCLHTGFAERLLSMEGKPDLSVLNNACAVLDGTDERLLQWVGASGVAAIVADNYAVEGFIPVIGLTPRPMVPLHVHCLFKLGVPLGELWHLTPLAEHLRHHKRFRFFLSAPPLRLPGAVGSPVTPIATV